MAAPIITLTTDFGTRSPFVAAMKGVVLGVNPAAHLVDLSHDIPPFDVGHAARFLRDALPYFPPEALHVVVVDPGVGGAREILYVEAAGRRLLAPDNGCWTLLSDAPREVRVLRERRFWRPEVSSTFHGRDIFAPVAAHLSLGVPPADLGPLTDQWQKYQEPRPRTESGGVRGEVVGVDHFGNLLTNVTAADLPGAEVCVSVQGLVPPLVRTYSDAAVGAVVALIGSNGRLEIAVVQGDAAVTLGAGVGTPVHIQSTT